MIDYAELVNELRENASNSRDLYIADAIEKLVLKLDKANNSGVKTNNWIPVTERLPKLHEEVLVCNEDYGLSELGFAMVAVWDGANWVETWNKKDAIHYITHWMPLPEPPKEES